MTRIESADFGVHGITSGMGRMELARMEKGFGTPELESAEEPGRVANQRPHGDLGSDSPIRL